jgi:hypothetical protein
MMLADLVGQVVNLKIVNRFYRCCFFFFITFAAGKDGFPAVNCFESEMVKSFIASMNALNSAQNNVVCSISDPPKKTYDFEGSIFVGETPFLKNFDPTSVDPVTQTCSAELAQQFLSSDPSLPHDDEQITSSTDINRKWDFVAAANMNADLGLQYTLREILRHEVLVKLDANKKEHPTLVIVSHGHALAGLTELAKMTTKDSKGKERYLFDTTVYLPQGGWTNDFDRMALSGEAAQIWGDNLEATRKDLQKKGIRKFGGMAIALNGHRGDRDPRGKGGKTANIDPEKMLGPPKKFLKIAKSRGINRVVIVTENLVKDPNKINYLTIEMLKKGPDHQSSFDNANKDLYSYMKKLRDLGLEIVVVSGEQRTSDAVDDY